MVKLAKYSKKNKIGNKVGNKVKSKLNNFKKNHKKVTKKNKIGGGQLAWANREKRDINIITLTKTNNSEIILCCDMCIQFELNTEIIKARILGFKFSGRGPPDDIFYLPWIDENNQWNTRGLGSYGNPRISIPKDSYDSIEIIDCADNDNFIKIQILKELINNIQNYLHLVNPKREYSFQSDNYKNPDYSQDRFQSLLTQAEEIIKEYLDTPQKLNNTPLNTPQKLNNTPLNTPQKLNSTPLNTNTLQKLKKNFFFTKIKKKIFGKQKEIKRKQEEEEIKRKQEEEIKRKQEEIIDLSLKSFELLKDAITIQDNKLEKYSKLRRASYLAMKADEIYNSLIDQPLFIN